MEDSKLTNGTKTAKATVQLIPWDPESPEHVARLYDQRVQCGWKKELVYDVWINRQREGSTALQWVCLNYSDPDRDAKLAAHLEKYPAENAALIDSAVSLGGKPNVPSRKEFIPIGHISLDTSYESPGYFESDPSTYFIATFYISTALQHSGLGRAAMDAVESMATSEPLNARTLVLSCVDDSDSEKRREKFKALGRDPPKISNMHWYARRGYVVFKRAEGIWTEPDPTGRLWGYDTAFMRKEIH